MNDRDDHRRFVVAIKMGDDSPIEYVRKTETTGRDAVRLSVKWTTDIRKALVWTMRDLMAPGTAYTDIRCGFARCAIRKAPR
jgi:hypothetical protein